MKVGTLRELTDVGLQPSSKTPKQINGEGIGGYFNQLQNDRSMGTGVSSWQSRCEIRTKGLFLNLCTSHTWWFVYLNIIFSIIGCTYTAKVHEMAHEVSILHLYAVLRCTPHWR